MRSAVFGIITSATLGLASCGSHEKIVTPLTPIKPATDSARVPPIAAPVGTE